ncbi:hypothetical protein SASPL_109532 [Salvia splendens]|uniref:Uncharacterized protein n=1 Tax=Salvia splendens TaxID=180675 RepID=A0A8X8YF15_SALSN|nr:hypothetical protein SASPL_109532 [Salvia splendens]
MSLHTTHSPNFLGLHQNMGLWEDSNYGKGVIIGVLDTGVLPEHPSFSEEGMPPPPAKWKGKCQFNHTTCNYKIIGAWYFNAKDQSPLDDNGHGTHTAGTAAGRFVQGANLFGSTNGSAAGIAPLAHLAIYKVLSTFGTDSKKIAEIYVLAGMDAAIEDGVDVLSMSIGYRTQKENNDGPHPLSLRNVAPWVLTVGASTMDRKLSAKAVLGNNQPLDGESVFQLTKFPKKLFPLVYAGYTPDCLHSLSRSDIRGKIAVCEVRRLTETQTGAAALKSGGGTAGAAGMIFINDETEGNTIIVAAIAPPNEQPEHTAEEAETDAGVAVPVYTGSVFQIEGPLRRHHSAGVAVPVYTGTCPACSEQLVCVDTNRAETDKFAQSIASLAMEREHLPNFKEFKEWLEQHSEYKTLIKAYINSTENPTAIISFQGTVIGDERAPVVASFSSKGPSIPTLGILKPDILGPGVNILAAWPTSVEGNTNTKSTFNIISGTSMSCLHLSGLAALLKSVHPDWSQSAIKSAIMTTADDMNLAGNPIEDQRFLPADIFATGSGHVNPSRAKYPGLVYDIQSQDYLPYLCGLNYTNHQAYTRIVTNVGDPDASYEVEISTPRGVDVLVEPTTLKFSEIKQKLQYNVTFTRLTSALNTTFSQGFLKWTSARRSVGSPIAVILL